MITTVSLNPSVDRTLRVRSFTYGGMNRVVSARSDAGGKAINVAITAARLELATECVGILHKENGSIIENRLLAGGAGCDFVRLDGRVRTNVKLLDESTGQITEINESGMPISAEALDQMLDLISNHAASSDYLVLTGSLPPGCPEDFYRIIIEQVEGLGCRCVLDAEGGKFLEGVKAQPFLIKPNQYELEMAVGHKLESLEEVRNAAISYIDMGVQNVAVSMGAKGALITDGEETLYAPSVEIKVVNTVGAGDAMVAGLVAGFLAERSLEDVLRMGVAAGTASCMTEGTQLIERETYKKLLQTVLIENM